MARFLKLALLVILLAPAAFAAEKPIWQQEAEKAAPPAPARNLPTSYTPGEDETPTPAGKNLDDPNQVYYNPEEIKEQAPHNETPPADATATPAPAAPVIPGENPAPAPELPKWVEAKIGKVKALNKVYSRNKEFDIIKGEEAKFGAIKIKLEKCFRVPESDKKESSALLLITETFKSLPSKEIFHGWMFSSSPAISALEHPLYDVILLDCEDEHKPEPVPEKKLETPKPKK